MATWSLWSAPLPDEPRDNWNRVASRSTLREIRSMIAHIQNMPRAAGHRPRKLHIVKSERGEQLRPPIDLYPHPWRSSNPHHWSAYRDLGRPGTPYPQWVQDLKGRNGVYAIRHGAELVYVGESHSDRLYETMTRHFQRWECEDEKCRTYPRSASTVSVILTSAAEAPTLQAHTILEREPRDNIYETEESTTDATPF